MKDENRGLAATRQRSVSKVRRGRTIQLVVAGLPTVPHGRSSVALVARSGDRPQLFYLPPFEIQRLAIHLMSRIEGVELVAAAGLMKRRVQPAVGIALLEHVGGRRQVDAVYAVFLQLRPVVGV